MKGAKLYRGPLMMNNRSIDAALASLLGAEEGNSAPMPVSELVNVLSFLESAVMSKQIYFDGTLPEADRRATLRRFDLLDAKASTLGVRKHLGINVRPTAVDKKAFASLLDASVSRSFELIERLDTTAENPSRPVGGDIGAFRAFFDTYIPSGAREEAALALNERILGQTETFRGSKCVSALLTCRKGENALYDIVYHQYRRRQSDAEKRLLIGSLIDRFRVNFINAQAQEHRAAYLSSPQLEPLRDQQILLFWKYVFKTMGREQLLARETGVADRLFDHSFASFPIGLAVLINTKGTHPLDLLETAGTYYNRHFARIASELSVENDYIHLPEAHVMQLEEQAFRSHFSALQNRSYRPVSRPYRFGKKLLPVATKFTLGELSDWAETLLPDNLLLENLGEAALERLQETFEQTIFKTFSDASRNDRFNLYVDHYQRLNTFYASSLDTLEDGLQLSKKVERIFGRKLVRG